MISRPVEFLICSRSANNIRTFPPVRTPSAPTYTTGNRHSRIIQPTAVYFRSYLQVESERLTGYSISRRRFLFHYVREKDVVYLCMADEAFGRRIPFAFLQAIQKDFEPYSVRASTAIAYAFNREFAPILKRQMAYFSKSSGRWSVLVNVHGS